MNTPHKASLSLCVAFVFSWLVAAPLHRAQAEAEAEAKKKTMGEAGDILTPLAIGNAWVYASPDDDLLTTDRIEGVVLIGGQPWHLLNSYEHQANQPADKAELVSSNLWLTHRDGHECEAFAQLGEETGELVLDNISSYFRYPAALGETYQPNPNNTAMRIEVIAIHEKVKTKAGEFDCIVYRETDTDLPDYSYTNWVCPGVGIVKNQTKDEDDIRISELVSYTLVDEK